MKNKVSYPFYLIALLFLCGAFFNQPATAGVVPNGDARSLTVHPGGIYVTFAGKYGGEITRQEVEKQTELKVEGCFPGSRIFDATLAITKNGRTTTLKTTSGVLTAEMRTQLKGLTKGDVFEFRNTRVYLPNGQEVADARGSKFVVV